MNYYDLIERYYNAQNIGADNTQKNLFSKEQYRQISSGVLEVIKEEKDASLSELREKIIERSKYKEELKDFFLNRKMAPGAVINLGTDNYEHTFYCGNKEEVRCIKNKIYEHIEPISDDTIFDLASITKLFTGICILKLVEEKEINLTDNAGKYVPQFENIKDLTIFDLLTFTKLKTDKKIISAKSQEEAQNILFTVKRVELKEGENPYNDFSSMVLKYVIEKISGTNYYQFLKETVLDKLNMEDTLVKIDNDKINRVASNNCDVRYYLDGSIIERNYIFRGVSSDDKARVLGQEEGLLSGHAGLFSTAHDMSILASSLKNGYVLKKETIKKMAKNVTGKPYIKEDGSTSYSQYLGMLCYSKCPNIIQSEVYHALSGESFAIAGWSGTQFTLDPINKIHLFLGSNRSHNRLTINNHPEKTIIGENKRKVVILPNGREIIDSSLFAYDRDLIIHKGIILALQLKMLEDIVGIEDEKELKKELVY